jgi:polygalacturonase
MMGQKRFSLFVWWSMMAVTSHSVESTTTFGSTTLLSLLDVSEFGAVGDGITDDTQAIRKALSIAKSRNRQEEPGSIPVTTTTTLYFPMDKVFVSAPLNLSSNLILHVDGTLQAITNETLGFDDKWPQLPPLPSYGNSRDGGGHYLQYQSFLHAQHATNIQIRGQGIIDGKGAWWWDQVRNKNASSLRAGRPNLIQFVNCSQIEITGVTLKDSPFWTVHPVYSRDIHIHHTTIRAPLHAPNVDGIDPDSSRNVLIEHNDISCGDDHIAIKAGVCGDGRRRRRRDGDDNKASVPDCRQDVHFARGDYISSNITIRYNILRTGMGIAFGSELSGGIENVFVYQNIIGLCDYYDNDNNNETSCGWGHAIHFKTTLTRGGFLRYIYVHTNLVYNTTTGFLLLETDYQDKEQQPPDYPTTRIHNISIQSNSGMGLAKDMRFECSKYMVCENITVSDNWISDDSSSSNYYHCSYIDTYQVENNIPKGLERCMYESMNRSESIITPFEFPS